MEDDLLEEELLERECMEEKLTKSIYKEGRWGEFLKQNVCEIAAYYGWIDLLEWAHELYKFEWNEKIFQSAARGNQFEMMKYLQENGCPMHSSAYVYAVDLFSNKLEVIKWLKDKGCDYDEDLCYLISREYDKDKYDDIISWLNKNDCPCKRTYH